MRFQQDRRHCGRKGQRVDRRDHCRHRNRHRELVIELPGDPRNKGGWHEDGDQDQRRPDDGALHFVHRAGGGVACAHPFGDVPFNILDHHNGVIDHDANGEDQTKQREQVQRVAKRQHDREGPDQRDRDGEQRDDCGAPALQKDDNDEHDEHNRLKDRLVDGIDRCFDELRRIVDDAILQPRGEILRHVIHRRDDGLRRGKGV